MVLFYPSPPPDAKRLSIESLAGSLLGYMGKAAVLEPQAEYPVALMLKKQNRTTDC